MGGWVGGWVLGRVGEGWVRAWVLACVRGYVRRDSEKQLINYLNNDGGRGALLYQVVCNDPVFLSIAPCR